MAKEQSVGTFSKIASGGGAGSPYLQSFIQPAERARSNQFDRELAFSREMRQMRAEDIAEERSKREDIREARRAQEEQRRYERSEKRLDLAQRRQDAAERKQLLQEEALTNAAEAEGKILALDPINMGFDYNARQLLQDPQVKRALTGPHASTILKSLNDQKTAFSNQLKHYQSVADEAGLAGDVRQYADKTGMMDDMAFSTAVEAARVAKANKLAQEQATQTQNLLAAGAKAGLEVSQMNTKGEIGMARPRVEKEDPEAIIKKMMGNGGTPEGKTPKGQPSSPLPVQSTSITLDDFPSLTP